MDTIMINKDDIQEFVINNISDGLMYIMGELYNLYNITDPNSPDKYVVDNIVEYYYNEFINKQKIYCERKEKLAKLKMLDLPEQRSEEWYAMRRDKLTASSIEPFNFIVSIFLFMLAKKALVKLGYLVAAIKLFFL